MFRKEDHIKVLEAGKEVSKVVETFGAFPNLLAILGQWQDCVKHFAETEKSCAVLKKETEQFIEEKYRKLDEWAEKKTKDVQSELDGQNKLLNVLKEDNLELQRKNSDLLKHIGSKERQLEELDVKHKELVKKNDIEIQLVERKLASLRDSFSGIMKQKMQSAIEEVTGAPRGNVKDE